MGCIRWGYTLVHVLVAAPISDHFRTRKKIKTKKNSSSGPLSTSARRWHGRSSRENDSIRSSIVALFNFNPRLGGNGSSSPSTWHFSIASRSDSKCVNQRSIS